MVEKKIQTNLFLKIMYNYLHIAITFEYPTSRTPFIWKGSLLQTTTQKNIAALKNI